MADVSDEVRQVLRDETRPGGVFQPRGRAKLAVQALDQVARAKLLIETDPELAAKILGCAIDSVILVDGVARTRSRQEMLRLGRLVYQAHPHLTCG